MTPRPPEIRHGLTTVEIDKIIEAHDALVAALRALESSARRMQEAEAYSSLAAAALWEATEAAARLLRDLDAASQQEERDE